MGKASKTVKAESNIEENVTKSGRKKREKRPQMDLASCTDSAGTAIPLDDKERLTAIPSNWTPTFRKFSRSNFADKGHFYEWLIAGEEARLARTNSRIEELKELADEAREGPDPTKKALRRLARMAKVAKELRAQLEAEGVDLSELDI